MYVTLFPVHSQVTDISQKKTGIHYNYYHWRCMSRAARMHFQDVKEVDGKEVYEMSPDSIIFDPSLPAKTQAKVKADICAARPLKRARKPVTDEADRRKARAVRRRRRDMVKSQEKVEKATIRASQAAKNYIETVGQGEYDEEDEDEEDEDEEDELMTSSDESSRLSDVPSDV